MCITTKCKPIPQNWRNVSLKCLQNRSTFWSWIFSSDLSELCFFKQSARMTIFLLKTNSSRSLCWRVNNLVTATGLKLKQPLSSSTYTQHLGKLAKWLSCVVSTYVYDSFDYMFLSCNVKHAHFQNFLAQNKRNIWNMRNCNGTRFTSTLFL